MATGDYTTLANLKEYCEIPTSLTTRDAWLTRMISSTSRAIDNYCNRRFYARTVSRVYDYQTGYRLWFKDDLYTVTQILHGAGRAEVLDPASYFLYPEIGPPYQWMELSKASTIQLRWSALTDQQAIEVQGVWGYLESGSTPTPIEAACCGWINYIRTAGGKHAGVQSETIGDYSVTFFQAMSILAQGPPAEVKSFLDPYKAHARWGTSDRTLG